MQPCGDRCLVVAFDETDVALSNAAACRLASLLLDAQLPGVGDIVPSMAAVGVHYDPAAVAVNQPEARPWDTLARQVEALMSSMQLAGNASAREIVLPVCYGGEYGEDLEEVARTCGLTPDQVIGIHSGTPVSVLMLGFAPGHPYIGMFDQRLSIGRRATPRTAVPRGSIGLANRQSVIYPTVLPGGWSLIGRTPLTLFSAHRDVPCLLNAGDLIRFKPITASEFAAIEREQQQEDGQ
ncbi:5-oxoprolinase subunit PxpB [Bordetella sp. BOR01]|uniref:5-oxoprolinase subunit PxpB n=1 Tax=Bordetella sp. BOR01 TaxID=2854779 RepID=UPI001C45C1F3|nr:5-oxoprolinase subunit PxpB [Bordetella sp. BOR01]MBV7483817.1 5-oxoprolinase subunit PxpB [Bordetella sp. BOR01]